MTFKIDDEPIAGAFGVHLKSLRANLKTLFKDKDTQLGAGDETSNTRLGQLENESTSKPSPNIPRGLAAKDRAPAAQLKAQVRYTVPRHVRIKRGLVPTFSIKNLSARHMQQFLVYLAYVRSWKGKA